MSSSSDPGYPVYPVLISYITLTKLPNKKPGPPTYFLLLTAPLHPVCKSYWLPFSDISRILLDNDDKNENNINSSSNSIGRRSSEWQQLSFIEFLTI